MEEVFEQISKIAKDKNLIVTLGATGAGKSTLLTSLTMGPAALSA